MRRNSISPFTTIFSRGLSLSKLGSQMRKFGAAHAVAHHDDHDVAHGHEGHGAHGAHGHHHKPYDWRDDPSKFNMSFL